MKALDKAIESYLRSAGLDWILDYLKVRECSEAVLKSYDFLKFYNFRNGILSLKVVDRRRMMEIYYNKFSIIKAINTIIGKEIVKDIKFL